MLGVGGLAGCAEDSAAEDESSEADATGDSDSASGDGDGATGDGPPCPDDVVADCSMASNEATIGCVEDSGCLTMSFCDQMACNYECASGFAAVMEECYATNCPGSPPPYVVDCFETCSDELIECIDDAGNACGTEEVEACLPAWNDCEETGSR